MKGSDDRGVSLWGQHYLLQVLIQIQTDNEYEDMVNLSTIWRKAEIGEAREAESFLIVQASLHVCALFPRNIHQRNS